MQADMDVGFQHAYCVLSRTGNMLACSAGYRKILSRGTEHLDTSSFTVSSSDVKSIIKRLKNNKSTLIKQHVLKRADGSAQLLEVEYTLLDGAGDTLLIERARPTLMTSVNDESVRSRASAIQSIGLILSDLALMASKWNLGALHSFIVVLARQAKQLA